MKTKLSDYLNDPKYEIFEKELNYYLISLDVVTNF
jgi:hypothetical protein